MWSGSRLDQIQNMKAIPSTLFLILLSACSIVVHAQDCEQLKADIEKNSAQIEALRTDFEEASSYDEKKALTLEIRELEDRVGALRVEYGECASSAGLMTGDTYLLNQGLRQRASGSILTVVGAGVAVAGAAVLTAPLMAAGGIIGLIGGIQIVSGSSKVLKATKE